MSAPPLRCEGAVLVVDDEADTRELLREILGSRGYTVTTAGDGVEALEVLRSDKSVCFVILDLVMPRLDGLGVWREISSDSRLQKIPLCISTSAPDRAPAGVRCLPKPVDLERLFAMVDEHCLPITPA